MILTQSPILGVKKKIDTTSHEGPMIDAVTSNYGLHQLIQEQTHIRNFPSPCIDLIFTSQPNLFMESGVHSTLHRNCHHQVVFAKFNFYILYPSPYERTVWFYEKANAELIQSAINEFDWTKALPNVSVDEKVCYFTKKLLDIIHNFIPHEIIIFDDRDPPWINNEIEKLMNEKNSACQS